MSKRKAQQVRPLGRLARRRLRNGLDLEALQGPPLGPGLATADLATVTAAIERFDPDMPSKKARDRVLPMLPRARPFRGPQLDLVRTMLPPGILVSFGIDIGPAVMFVGEPLIDRWDIDPSSLASAALANVRRLGSGCRPNLVVSDSIAGVPVAVLQSRKGIAASLLLVPDVLERFFGSGPCLLLAPMRDILISMPSDVDREFAVWLAGEWEDLDPNSLHLGAFRFEGGTAVPEPLDEVLARA
jgi:hypothetical protein